MPRLLAAAIALTACAAALLSAAAAAASWRAPVRGAVVRPFDYSARAPFARGARRGADFAASRGEAVAAPCSGRVTFAGRVPRFGPALSIRCGALVATLLGVRAERRGAVPRGARVGRATGVVRLGARRAADRFAYIDPLSLIGGEPRTPLGPAPAAPPAARAPRRPQPAAAQRREPVRVPWMAWAGLGLLGSLLGPWAISTSRRRSTTSTLRRTWATRTR